MSFGSRLRKSGSRACWQAASQARAIGELETLLARHPWRESLWGLLMLAYYREGRQAEALRSFQRAREILADELGIDPSPELLRLHERVLQQDPGLDLRGEPLRGYRLLEKVDDGPTGAVFRAIQPHVERDVAVKIFHEGIAADPEFVRRFDPDAQAIAALEHPHIAPIYDYWREPGRAYIVSRYLARGEPSSHRGTRGAAGAGPGPSRSSSRFRWRSRSPTARGSRTGTLDRPTSCSTRKGTPISGTS